MAIISNMGWYTAKGTFEVRPSGFGECFRNVVQELTVLSSPVAILSRRCLEIDRVQWVWIADEWGCLTTNKPPSTVVHRVTVFAHNEYSIYFQVIHISI